jgi:hypothetical protein
MTGRRIASAVACAPTPRLQNRATEFVGHRRGLQPLAGDDLG